VWWYVAEVVSLIAPIVLIVPHEPEWIGRDEDHCAIHAFALMATVLASYLAVATWAHSGERACGGDNVPVTMVVNYKRSGHDVFVSSQMAVLRGDKTNDVLASRRMVASRGDKTNRELAHRKSPYRLLQRRAKAVGLPANRSAEELRRSLGGNDEDDDVDEVHDVNHGPLASRAHGHPLTNVDAAIVTTRRRDGTTHVGTPALVTHSHARTEWCLDVFRGLTVLMTCFAILAVDFNFFPLRHAKTENFGVRAEE
jgi:hypothetical protein